MAESESGAEQTEQPTEKRLRETRERGQVARSRELSSAAVTVSAASALFMAGGTLAATLAMMLRNGLSIEPEALTRPENMTLALAHGASSGLAATAPVLAAATLAAIAAPLALGGFVWSPTVFVPDPSRLSPIEGFKRVFGVVGLMELVKALLKVVVVGSLAAMVSYRMTGHMVALGSMPALAAIGGAAHMLVTALLVMSSGLVLIAAVDAPFQWWNHHRRLKMTREEVREEMKETEGRPEIKAKIRNLQRAMARRRMMTAVPKADVVVTNPTHYSVALKYEPRRMRAPRVLAKGKDLVALEIRRIASEHGVPLFAAPSLARALHGSTELDREIPPGLYVAVAQVLSYVYQVKTLSAHRAARLRRPSPPVGAEFDRWVHGELRS
jgi:flagellar biosynthesis protein FlhB